MKILNLLNKSVKLLTSEQKTIIFHSVETEKSKRNLEEELELLFEDEALTIPLFTLSYHQALPPIERGTLLLVSREIAFTNSHRSDLIFPGDSIKNDNQEVIAYINFHRVYRQEWNHECAR